MLFIQNILGETIALRVHEAKDDDVNRLRRQYLSEEKTDTEVAVTRGRKNKNQNYLYINQFYLNIMISMFSIQ